VAREVPTSLAGRGLETLVGKQLVRPLLVAVQDLYGAVRLDLEGHEVEDALSRHHDVMMRVTVDGLPSGDTWIVYGAVDRTLTF
jgi:hypothetical protein